MNDLFGTTISRGAFLSDCGTYRYKLYRTWDHLGPRVLWILLNPSTADGEQEDATTRRLAAFTRAWGCGGYALVNLFAFRATDPADLRRAADPVGPENGNYRGRDKKVLDTMRRMGRKVEALKITKDGYPQHPLYLRGDSALVPFCPK